MLQASIEPTFAAWRNRARDLLQRGVAPQQVVWNAASERFGEQQRSLFSLAAPSSGARGVLHVPPSFLQRAREVACHRDPGRWDLLYRVLWRLTHGEAHLFDRAADPDTRAFNHCLAAVRRDVHKCHAFVRFREVNGEFIAWYRPDHFILPLAAPHFVNRFAGMRWRIVSSDASVHWDGQRLHHGPGSPKAPGPEQDQVETLWRLYYAAIFNPARLKLRAMRQEMPRRYWAVMPETQLIDQLVAQASTRLQHYAALLPPSAVSHVPAHPTSLTALAQAAKSCAVCSWCSRSSQTVFGAGSPTASIVLVGEQPGDQEDRFNQPFVGPAGEVLQRALDQVGLSREAIYVTNAVKHFKWSPRGKKRLHQRPSAGDIAACKPWLSAEMKLLRPRILVCLGATAAQAVLGKAVKLQAERGRILRTAFCERTLVTTHPAAILRAGDDAAQQKAYALFVAELKMACDAHAS